MFTHKTLVTDIITEMINMFSLSSAVLCVLKMSEVVVVQLYALCVDGIMHTMYRREFD